MKRFFRHTLVNVIAFGTTSLVGLFLLPLIVAAYGLESFGLIVLARTLLPGGILGLLDFGTGDAATRYVASSMAEHDPRKAGHSVLVSLLITMTMGAMVALVAGGFSGFVAHTLLGLSTADAAAMEAVIRWTGLAALIAFPGLVAEGALRGLERFDLLRAIEVGATLLYAAATLLAIQRDYPFTTVAFAFLVATTLRYAIVLACLPFTAIAFSLRGFSIATQRPLLRLAWRLFQGKVLSNLLVNLAPVLISHFVGTAGVGLYDAILRIPRFAKAVVGLLSNAVLPISARMEIDADPASRVRFLDFATRVNLLIAAPPLITAILFADELFVRWIGQDFAGYSGYFALMLTWPLMTATMGVGNAMMVARIGALGRLNLIAVLQLLVYFLVIGLMLIPLREKAFLIATVVATATTVPLQVALLVREYAPRQHWFLNVIGRALLSGIPTAILVFTIKAQVLLQDVIFFLVLLLTSLLLYWVATLFLLIEPDERRKGILFLKGMLIH